MASNRYIKVVVILVVTVIVIRTITANDPRAWFLRLGFPGHPEHGGSFPK